MPDAQLLAIYKKTKKEREQRLERERYNAVIEAASPYHQMTMEEVSKHERQ